MKRCGAAAPAAHINAMEHAIELPDDAKAELARALARLRDGGGAVVRVAQRLARMGSAPLLRGLEAFGAAGLEPVAKASLERAFGIAVLGLPDTYEAAGGTLPGGRFGSAAAAHVATAVSGAVSGAAGLLGALPDAALTTLLIMRQIAAVALAEGEDLSTEGARLACLEVFALDSGDEGGYWGARLLLRGAPIATVLAQAARPWGIALTEKLAAQAAPVVGAAGGALVNTAFLAHFRTLARGHFTVRRLERMYGAEAVRAAAAAMA
jgi:hypothetical protein